MHTVYHAIQWNNVYIYSTIDTIISDYKNQVRWLNGLGCEGNELSISECGTPDWGQIGICSWDSVAAVICSNTEGNELDDTFCLVSFYCYTLAYIHITLGFSV